MQSYKHYSRVANVANRLEALVEWPNSKSDYGLGEVIGIGTTGIVQVAFCYPLKDLCAIKRIDMKLIDRTIDILKGLGAMDAFRHPNIASYTAHFIDKEELWLIMRLREGSLLDAIKYKPKIMDCRKGVLDEDTIATVLRKVLRGLEYLHNNGQIHKNVKAGNILLNEDGTVQIADFRINLWLSTEDGVCQTPGDGLIAKECWMAPELLKNEKHYDCKIDIWSFGVTAIELAIGKPPYYKYPPNKVRALISESNHPTLDFDCFMADEWMTYGKPIKRMIAICLQKEPSKRPSASELLKHPFFKKAKHRNFLQKSLVPLVPSIQTKAMLIKSSGYRLKENEQLQQTRDEGWVTFADE